LGFQVSTGSLSVYLLGVKNLLPCDLPTPFLKTVMKTASMTCVAGGSSNLIHLDEEGVAVTIEVDLLHFLDVT
jgi:hypothetical protein